MNTPSKHLLICTLEADCWSRDLPYEDYKRFADALGVTALHLPVYEMICKALSLQLEIDVGGEDE